MAASLIGAPGGEITVFQAPDGAVRVEVRLERDTVWLTQAQMAELFGRERSVVTKHVRNLFREGELEADSVCAKFAHTAADGKTYQVDAYNLDVIISVGYRVKSARGTQFRIWATQVLREHLVKGYTANAARLRDLNQAVRLVASTAQRRELSGDEAQARSSTATSALPRRCSCGFWSATGRCTTPTARRASQTARWWH